MPSYLAPEPALWRDLCVVLGVGTAVIVAGAAAARGWLRSGIWQRTLWRAVTLSLLALVGFELTGIAPGLVQLCRAARVAARPEMPLPAPEMSLPVVMPVADAESVVAPAAAVDTVFPPAAAAARQGTWWPAVLWAIGAGAILARMAWARALLVAFRRQCDAPCDEATLGRVRAMAERLAVRRPVRVLLCPRLGTPVVFGSLRPVLVLPAGFAADFDARQQDAVLAHELAHLAARDPAWHCMALSTCGLLWWHPLAWWSRRQLRAASEAAADEASLLLPGGPCALAESLVRLGRLLLRPRALAWLSVEGGFRSGLGRRVERLLRLGGGSRPAPRPVRLACARLVLPVAFTVLAVLGTASARPRFPSCKERRR